MNRLAIRGARLFDGIRPGVTAGSLVLVEENRIAWVGNEANPPGDLADYMSLDARGQTLLPGLINCHVHITADPDPKFMPTKALSDTPATAALRAARNCRLTLEGGETTVRDMGSTKLHVTLDLARAIAQGLVPGPRLVAAGSSICMTGGHGWFIGREADGPDEVRKAAREQLKAGAGVVKLMASGGVLTPGLEVGGTGLSVTEMAAGVEEAHNAGMRTAAHAIGTLGIKNALLAGIDSVEHGCLLDEECIELLLRRRAYYVPTLSAVTQIVRHADEGEMPEYVARKARQVYDRHCSSFRMAKEAGVLIAAGTDGSTPYNPHGGLALELELMVENGFTPWEALRAATDSAARVLGLEDRIGSVTVGKQADLLLVDGNPLDDIGALRRVRTVIGAGSLLVQKSG